jgi:sugar lactone lactonase YvrE
LSTDGRIYVACSTAEFRHVVLQYSAAGSLVWRNDAFAGGSWDDMPRSLAVDALGNAIVAGQVTTPETGNDYAIRKLDGAGKVLWDTRYNGVGHGDDSAASLVIDGQGGILVTGTSLVAGRGRELATVKYDALGRQEWVATHDPPGEIAYSSGLAADPDGNVFVAGSYFGLDSIESMLLVKYDASGRQMWTAAEGGISPGHAEAAGLAADQDGNAYLVGTNGGYVAIRYAPDGTVVWRRTYLPAGDFPYARAVAVAGIDTGGICVTGTAGSPSTDTFLRHPQVRPRWQSPLGGQAQLAPWSGPWRGHSDRCRRERLRGDYDELRPGHSVARFLKYDADGNLRWESGFGVNRVAQFGVTAIAVDTPGNLYVTGPLILPSRDAITCATLKFNRAGVIEWNAFRHRAKFQNPRGLALDARGNVYVTGSARDDEEESAMETLKYNPDGTEIWAAQWMEKKGPENGASAIALDSEGSVLIAGTGSGLTGARDFVTVKYVEDDGSARFLRGDCNGDGMVRGSVTDALYLLSFSFLGGAPHRASPLAM